MINLFKRKDDKTIVVRVEIDTEKLAKEICDEQERRELKRQGEAVDLSNIITSSILNAEKQKELNEIADFKARKLPVNHVIALIVFGLIAVSIFCGAVFYLFIEKQCLLGLKMLMCGMLCVLIMYTIYVKGKSTNTNLLLNMYSILIAVVSLIISIVCN